MADNSPLIPMEPEFRPNTDNPSAVRQIMADYYTDKKQPIDSDSSGVGPNRSIPKYNTPETNLYDPYCNYLGYEAGNKVLVGWDEYKILNSTVNAVAVVNADDCQTIDGQGGKERI